jgi:amino acid transporter
MSPDSRPSGFTPRTLAAFCLCAVLVGSTALYFGKTPVFLCLYCLLSALGFYLILRRSGAGIRAAGAAVICIQIAALAGFSIFAFYHRDQNPHGVADAYQQATSTLQTYQPIKFILPPWYREIFFEAVTVILCLLGLEWITPPGSDSGNPKSRIPWAVLLALAIQGGLIHFWTLWEVESIAAHSTPTTSAVVGSLSAITGAWLFGSGLAGLAAASLLAITSLLTLVLATLASLAIGTRAARRALFDGDRVSYP